MENKGRARRRSHVKSKAGCLTCRLRHIRCDELRPQCRNCLKRGNQCDFSSQEEPPAPIDDDVDSMDMLWREISKWQLEGRELFEAAPLLSQPSNPAPVEDLRMMHHTSQITTGLVQNGGHLLALGTSSLPVFMDLARQHDFVKNALLGLATEHLNCLVKLTALESLGTRYRLNACTGLQRALTNFSKENSDAILATSIMLGWQSLESATYVKFMQGTSRVLEYMYPMEDQSRLRELFGGVSPFSGQRKGVLREYRNFSDAHLSSLVPLSDALVKLHEEVKHMKELRSTTLIFQCFIQNLRLFPPDSSPAKQLEILFPVRTWLPLMPSSFLAMGLRDPWALLTMAYYHVVQVAAAGKLPAAATPLFAIKRTEIILRIDAELRALNSTNTDETKTAQLRKSEELMRIPLLYAIDYRLRHFKFEN